MKEANHIGPEPCAGHREVVGEASVGERMVQPPACGYRRGTRVALGHGSNDLGITPGMGGLVWEMCKSRRPALHACRNQPLADRPTQQRPPAPLCRKTLTPRFFPRR